MVSVTQVSIEILSLTTPTSVYNAYWPLLYCLIKNVNLRQNQSLPGFVSEKPNMLAAQVTIALSVHVTAVNRNNDRSSWFQI